MAAQFSYGDTKRLSRFKIERSKGIAALRHEESWIGNAILAPQAHSNSHAVGG
jgi:hypothetical protein